MVYEEHKAEPQALGLSRNSYSHSIPALGAPCAHLSPWAGMDVGD